MMYTQKVLDIFYNPKNVGQIKGASGVGKVGNPQCGDIMKVYISVKNGIVTDAKFQTFGCTAAIASSSIATEMVKGKTLDEARKIKNSDVLAALGTLPPAKIHCSVLAEEAINAAIDDYEKKQKKLNGIAPTSLKKEPKPEKKITIKEAKPKVEKSAQVVLEQKKEPTAMVITHEKITSTVGDSKPVTTESTTVLSGKDAEAIAKEVKNVDDITKQKESFDLSAEIDNITEKLSKAVNRLK